MTDLDIEIARNAAANGRLFNVLVCAVMIALAVTRSDIYFLAALSSALSVGVAHMADLSRRASLGYVSMVCAILPFAFLLVIEGF